MDNLILFLLIFELLLLVQTLCEEGCEIGPNDKCKTCGKGKDCASCNFAYFLNNGKCDFISSFNAIYETTKENESIYFFGDYDKRYAKIIITALEIDGEFINSRNLYYTFPKIGKHSVKALIAIDGDNLMNLFIWNKNLISIQFTLYFNTFDIYNLGGFFAQCSRLEYVDLSTFDTGKVTHMGSMFSDCSSLKSLDLSNFDTKNVELMQNMFDGCKSLTSINFYKSF